MHAPRPSWIDRTLSGVLLVMIAVAAQGAELTVMTRNLYFGTDLAPIATATTVPGLIGAVTAAYAQVVASDPVARMGRIADEIAASGPQVVGLQEAALWRTYTPSSFNGGPGSEVVRYDFVTLLLDALAARGQSYALVTSGTAIDARAPGVVGGALSDVRLTDREAILVRTDLPAGDFRVLGSGETTYGASLTFLVGGQPVNSTHTFEYVDVDVGGAQFRVVNTHLEPAVPAVQLSQASELIVALATSTLPQVVLGDFNSPADGSGTPTYATMLAAGFQDAWLAAGTGPGFTCCQAGDLRNAPSTLNERLDYVFTRGGAGALTADVVGDALGDRTGGGLWPSDHAGLVVRVLAVPEPPTLALVLLVIATGAVALGVGRPARR